MHLLVLISIAIHSCYLGSKVVVSLLALELGASQFTVGILAALYALVPLLLGVWSGRLVDTVGMRVPMLVGAACTGVAMATGFLVPNLAGLFLVRLRRAWRVARRGAGVPAERGQPRSGELSLTQVRRDR